jgi:hypothetical protein
MKNYFLNMNLPKHVFIVSQVVRIPEVLYLLNVVDV